MRTSVLRRAVRRVARHRGEAATVAAFMVLVATACAMTGMTTLIARLAAAGIAGSVFAALATLWIPIAVIDFRRCTRETALRVQVQADLDRHEQEAHSRADEEGRIRARVEAVLEAGGPRIVYQPIVDMADETVLGYEALSRFDDDVAPDRWFADAARVGLNVELELAAVSAALAEVSVPEGVYVSVNVGPDVLVDPRLLVLVRGMPAGRVVIELTEHLVVEDYEQYRQVVADIRAAGARLAVDDAGSGYCGLRHIVDLSPDVIKVDQSLVRGIHVDRARRSLMVALVSFASDLGAVLIAEGVEDERDASALQRWGVRFAQGWHYGQPSPRPVASRSSLPIGT